MLNALKGLRSLETLLHVALLCLRNLHTACDVCQTLYPVLGWFTSTYVMAFHLSVTNNHMRSLLSRICGTCKKFSVSAGGNLPYLRSSRRREIGVALLGRKVAYDCEDVCGLHRQEQ